MSTGLASLHFGFEDELIVCLDFRYLLPDNLDFIHKLLNQLVLLRCGLLLGTALAGLRTAVLVAGDEVGLVDLAAVPVFDTAHHALEMRNSFEDFLGIVVIIFGLADLLGVLELLNDILEDGGP
jgi:hypothetical protein